MNFQQNQNIHVNSAVQGNKKPCCNDTCFKIFTWIFNILTWAFIAITIVSSLNEFSVAALVFLIIFYVIHFILHLFSNTFKYLKNMENVGSINETMKKLFYSPLTITFTVECYHYEIHHVSNQGNRTASRRKVTTFKGSENFQYYCWRDVSGEFNLDHITTPYARLKLNTQYIAHDQYTTNDLNVQRNNFFLRNRMKDQFMDTNTLVYIEGMQEHTMVKLSKDEPCMYGSIWFVIFTLLTIAPFYKCYVNSRAHKTEFNIKKKISTRVDLNQVQNTQNQAPRLIRNGTNVDFNEAPPLMHNNPAPLNEADLQPGEANREWNDQYPNQEDINKQINNNFAPPSQSIPMQNINNNQNYNQQMNGINQKNNNENNVPNYPGANDLPSAGEVLENKNRYD